jgi:hypothetical protein
MLVTILAQASARANLPTPPPPPYFIIGFYWELVHQTKINHGWFTFYFVGFALLLRFGTLGAILRDIPLGKEKTLFSISTIKRNLMTVL